MTASITIAREALLPALAAAVKAVERRNTIPVLQNLLLRASDGALTLTGTDLDTEIAVTRSCKVEGTVETTLPAQALHDIVRKLPDGSEVTLAGDDQAWTVSAGRSRFRLLCLPASDFHEMTAANVTHTFELSAASLLSMIATIRFAISSEETRYYLNGIHLHEGGSEDEPQLVAVSTDGHRLAKMPMPLPTDAAGMPAVIVHRKTVDLVSKILSDKGTVTIGLSEAKISLTTEDGTIIVSKLVDGSYPDYRRVLPSGNSNRFVVDRQALFNAIDRVTTISAQRGSAVKFAFGKEELVLAATNPDSGSAEEELSIDCTAGEPVEIGFNGRYCLDMLAACDADSVAFELGDAGAPALVRPVDAGAAEFVIMPMRV